LSNDKLREVYIATTTSVLAASVMEFGTNQLQTSSEQAIGMEFGFY